MSREITKQERNEERQGKIDKTKQMAEFDHYLGRVEHDPTLWKKNKRLQQFVKHVNAHRRRFRYSMGDDASDFDPRAEGTAEPPPTIGFISSIASDGYGQIEEEHPVLQVVSKDVSRAAGYNEKDPTHKCARLRLADGGGDVVVAQLCTTQPILPSVPRRATSFDWICSLLATTLSTNILK